MTHPLCEMMFQIYIKEFSPTSTFLNKPIRTGFVKY